MGYVRQVTSGTRPTCNLNKNVKFIVLFVYVGLKLGLRVSNIFFMEPLSFFMKDCPALY